MAIALTRGYYVLTKLEVSKISTTLTALKANFDPQSPTALMLAVAFIKQLNENLSTMVMDITIQKTEFSNKKSLKPSISVSHKVRYVEERVKSSEKDEASSILAPS